MSDQFNSLSGPIKMEVINKIDQLDLSTLDKVHLKLLVHCLEIFKDISSRNNVSFPTECQLMEWSEFEAKKLNDQNFSLLLFEQMNSAAQKLKDYSDSIGKKPLNLILDDLIILISKNN
tara:strand:+ start:1371 stop:1727 length:357 start_codon:yes stop_codon:yes gene_type:complete